MQNKISELIIAQNPQQIKLSSLPESPQVPEGLIEKLLSEPRLKGWQKLFVRTVAKSRNPGSKQIEKVKAIASTLGIGEGGEA